MTYHDSKNSSKAPSVCTSQFLGDLPSDVVYAIERGLPEADLPLVSDVDLVIVKHDFFTLYDKAKEQGMVVSVTLSYGGARIFLAFDDGGIKRFDCMWRCGYMGISICSTQQLLSERQPDINTGLPILTENAQATVAFAVKNAYGGAERYRALLEKHDMEVLGPGARRRWLAALALRRPFATLGGIIRMTIVYTARLAFPSGITVTGTTATALRDSDVLRYLFQDRIRARGYFHGFIRSRLGAELCIVNPGIRADIDLSNTGSLQSAEQVILDHLRKHQSHMHALTVAVS